MLLILLGDAQIPLLATMLLGGCLLKAAKATQAGSVAAGLGPTAMFPLRLRRPAAMAMCATEFCLGLGLILTAGQYWQGRPAELVRLGTGLLFLVATCSLIELRDVRPDVGCGCFGDFSKAPVTGRTIARSALLAAAALGTIKLPPIQLPRSADSLAILLVIGIAEVALLGLLSPEVKDVLVRIGYSAPCELRIVSQEQTLTTLQRSTQWRKHADLIADSQPSDIWRELCWRYIAFPSQYAGKDAELVFAVRLEHYRPVVLSALVDTATGAVLPWPVATGHHAHPARPRRVGATRPRLAKYPDQVPYADPASLPAARSSPASPPYPPA
jgi:hypothetical protein